MIHPKEHWSKHWLPSCAAHQRAQKFVPFSPHGSSSNRELSTRAPRCVAKKLMTSPFPGLLDDQLEVSQSGKRLDLLQISAEKGTLGHPTRDALNSAATSQRFLYDNTNCHVVTFLWTVRQDHQSHESGSGNHVPQPWAH